MADEDGLTYEIGLVRAAAKTFNRMDLVDSGYVELNLKRISNLSDFVDSVRDSFEYPPGLVFDGITKIIDRSALLSEHDPVLMWRSLSIWYAWCEVILLSLGVLLIVGGLLGHALGLLPGNGAGGAASTTTEPVAGEKKKSQGKDKYKKGKDKSAKKANASQEGWKRKAFNWVQSLVTSSESRLYERNWNCQKCQKSLVDVAHDRLHGVAQ